MQNFDHNIGFCEKRQFFRRKLSKIAENCDHNIDPRPYPFCRILATKEPATNGKSKKCNSEYFCCSGSKAKKQS
jgi:hypothetical protein